MVEGTDHRARVSWHSEMDSLWTQPWGCGAGQPRVPGWRDNRKLMHTLTVIRPAGVEEVVPVRGEGHIQDTPAYISGLDALELTEAAITAVIQSDCLVCTSRHREELGDSLPDVTSTAQSTWSPLSIVEVMGPGTELPGPL